MYNSVDLNHLKYLLKSAALLKAFAINLPNYSLVSVLISVVQPIGLATFENNLKGMFTSLLAFDFSL